MLRNNAKHTAVQCILKVLAATLLGMLNEILPKLNLLFFDFIYYI